MNGADGPFLAELGEWELIRRLSAYAPAGQFEDDAALLDGIATLVVNTDVLVENVHFSDATTSPFQVGWRAAAANLSDLAAMGCTAGRGLTVGLVAPGHTSWNWVEAMYAGLKACLNAYDGGELLGGDCSTGTQRLVSITALGSLDRTVHGHTTAIRRSVGQPGDHLVCTGHHGLSRLGLALLLNQRPKHELGQLPAQLRNAALRAHQEPRPRFDAVMALRQSRPPGISWRVAGTDTSDGLAAAATAIARASRCRALLDRSCLPIPPGMERMDCAETWCLAGGEDFELLLALDSAWADALMQQLPGCHLVGRLVAADGNEDSTGWLNSPEQFPMNVVGYSHFC
jgi:thiamine-monophosphate kinase